MRPEAGQRFGPYEVLELLGSGGMGVVFRAWDERLHREVAIKLLQDEYRAPGMRERFLLEARAASALAHPHICTIFDIGEQAGEPYLVMELLEGSTLKRTIGQRVCSAEEIVRYGEQMAEALGAAHAKGIVHRDIKPANVFLQKLPNGECTAKILDFGLAKVSMALRSGRDSRALELTSAGFTVGTLAYMSPEQARGEALDARTDLFSLGALLYEMATRRTPFRGATTGLAFQSLLGEPPDPIRKWNVTVPRELERIILRLLQKERGRRYPDAAELREALGKLSARNGGEWLRRMPAAVVPLVIAADPVARHARATPSKSREMGVEQEEPGDRVTENSGCMPSLAERAEMTGVLRPLRLPRQEQVPWETTPVRAGAATIAVASTGATSPSSQEQRIAEVPPLEGDALPLSKQPLRTALKIFEQLGGNQAETISATPDAGSQQAQAPAAGVKNAALGMEPCGPGMPTGALAHAAPTLPSLPTPVAINDSARVPREVASTSAAVITDPSFRRPQRPKISGRIAITTEEVEADQQPTVRNEPKAPTPATAVAGRTGWTLMLAVGAICVVVAILLLELRSGGFGTIVLGPKDSILLGPIANRTQDEALDGVVLEGLRLSLAEHSHLRWLGADALAAGTTLVSREEHLPATRVAAQAVAHRLGARAYIAGEITGRHGHEMIRLDVIDAASNDRLGSVSESAADPRDLPGAMMRISSALETKLGETSSTPGSSLNLQSGGTAAALGAFGRGENAAARGDLPGAAVQYRAAVARAPQFALAWLRLARIYEEQGAELPAAESAGKALATSSGASPQVKLMARTVAQLLREDDPMTAVATIRRAAAQWPEDTDLLVMLAHVMRSSGHMAEALLAAEKALAHDPYRGEAYREAALALIGQERYADALGVARQAAAHGVFCDCGESLARALLTPPSLPTVPTVAAAGAENALPTADAESSAPGLAVFREQALVLDASGHFAEGLIAWRRAAAEAQAQPEMISAAAGTLAIAASDRALAGRCSEAVVLAHNASLLAYGRRAAFHIALAGVLCPAAGERETRVAEERLEDGARASAFPMMQQVPLIRTAQALAAHRVADAVTAISLLPPEHDAPPLVAYLRGLSLEMDGRRVQAAAAFAQAAERPGYSLLTDTVAARLAAERLHHP